MRKIGFLFVAALVTFAALSVTNTTSATGMLHEDQLLRLSRESRTTATSGSLYDEIARMDSLLFNAFNTRDIETMKQCFDSSLEVYQDNQGLRNYTQAIEAFVGLFQKNYILTRTLAPGSMEVYPIKEYGAIQTGLHTFSHMEKGKLESATFKFLHIWQKRNGIWKITRLVTYDH
jgi:hypothetical protein